LNDRLEVELEAVFIENVDVKVAAVFVGVGEEKAIVLAKVEGV